MQVSADVKQILDNYESDNPGTKANLARMLLHGKLANTGKMVIYPVDQGFEHGPARSFAANPDAYDPHYHFKIAIDAGLSAYAAPLGMIEAGAGTFAGQIPTILKMNSSNSLMRQSDSPLESDQAITATVTDALRLGCSAVGFTIYPGADNSLGLFEEIKSIAHEAKRNGLAVIIWSYPRGNMSKEGETAVDVISYAAHIACLLGAHIVKVKLPTEHLEFKAAQVEYANNNVDVSTMTNRVSHIKQCCFQGRRMVIFSGGASKNIEDVYGDIKAIRDGGGNGSIIGRNVFRRPRDQAMDMLNKIVNIYL